ncbi:M20/M25/M40 family metallo-hydrolase [Subtercola sp. YIM 133946]|uniref:M20/M25/M40 family metallo-hydrolase n=1 Tax=Subtercola sp. YIM 133946 TaxID=3118909 RepID=UPI002F93C23D
MADADDTTGSVLLDDLRMLVRCESPSDDAEAIDRCAHAVAALGERVLGSSPEWHMVDGSPHLEWTFGDTAAGPENTVLLLGHFDTVWPIGSWPDLWHVEGIEATGPGCFDMKAGIVQILHAVARLDDASGISILLTSDEEVGSPSARELIRDRAVAAGVVLVTEASAPGGALKTERSGVAQYSIRAHGRAAHAGLEPEKGVNASIEIARQVLAVAELGARTPGASVTPTLLSAGTTANTVAAEATLIVDVRASTRSVFDEVDAAILALPAQVPGSRLEIDRLFASAPLEKGASAALFALAQQVAAAEGLAPLTSAAVGGASDGNIAAAAGALVLDGLGAVGGKAHAVGEFIEIDRLEERTVLLSALCRAIQTGGLGAGSAA